MIEPIYVNTPAAGIITKNGAKLIDRFHQAMLLNPSQAFDDVEDQSYRQTKKLAAKFLGAEIKEVAFIPNFSFGLSSVIASLEKKKNKILLYQDDFPSLNLPFELNGFDISYIPPGEFNTDIVLEKLEQTEVEILALSHVQYITGYRLDLETIGNVCRKKGIIFILDGTQSVGLYNYNFSVLPLDVLITSNYKWMNGGYGSGTICCKEKFIREFPPVIGGRNSFRMINDEFIFPRDINSFEPGHMPIHNLLLLNEALKEKLEIGNMMV